MSIKSMRTLQSAGFRAVDPKNNRRSTPGRRRQVVQAYAADKINNAQTSVEKARRARVCKNIRHA